MAHFWIKTAGVALAGGALALGGVAAAPAPAHAAPHGIAVTALNSDIIRPAGLNEWDVTPNVIGDFITRMNEIRVEQGFEPLPADRIYVGTDEFSALSLQHALARGGMDAHEGAILSNEIAVGNGQSIPAYFDYDIAESAANGWWDSEGHRDILYLPAAEGSQYGGPTDPDAVFVVNFTEVYTGEDNGWERLVDGRGGWTTDPAGVNAVPATEVDLSLNDYVAPTVPAGAEYDPAQEYGTEYVSDSELYARYLNDEPYDHPEPFPADAEPTPTDEPVDTTSPTPTDTASPAPSTPADTTTPTATEVADAAVIATEKDRYTVDETVAGVNWGGQGFEPDAVYVVQVRFPGSDDWQDVPATDDNEYIATADGAVSGALNYYRDNVAIAFPEGTFQLRVVQTLAAGDTVEAVTEFVVGDPATTATTSADDDLAANDDTRGDDQLAQTGADDMLPLILAGGLVLIAAGAGMYLVRRRADA